MTPRMALIGALTGVGLLVLGMFLALGPWALVACGAVLAVVCLLVPTSERVPEQGDGR